MGERKGVNKYYPPDFDWKKHGSLDKYHNSHPLRERARKLGEGILIIRLEMPYNVWCNGCNKHIGMGVRYNAEKKKIGKYYTTPIYKFRMKCHLCPQYFELQTDPAKCEYVLVSGARRKEERWDAKDNEQIEMTDHMDKKKLATDAMFKLEHGVKDRRKLASAIPTLEEIQDLQEEKKDDYILNKVLRNKFRSQKRSIETVAKQDQALLDKSSLSIKLLPEEEGDKNLAKLMKHNAVKSFEENQTELRREISQKPVLETTSPTNEVKTMAAKLPKCLGSALTRQISNHDLWGTTSTKTHFAAKSNHSLQKSLGIKVVKRKSIENNPELDKGLMQPRSVKGCETGSERSAPAEGTSSSGDNKSVSPSSTGSDSHSNISPNTSKSPTQNGGQTQSHVNKLANTPATTGLLVAYCSGSSSESESDFSNGEEIV